MFPKTRKKKSKWANVSLTKSIVDYYDRPCILTEGLSDWKRKIDNVKTVIAPAKDLIESVDDFIMGWFKPGRKR